MKSRSLPTALSAPQWFNLLLKATLGLYLRLRFRVRCGSRHAVTATQLPYLMIPNHVGYWDPFLAGLFVREPVHFVAADAVFRSSLVRPLLRLVGAVPKTKGVSDLEMVRNLLRIRDAGGIIGLFAEGGRTWDGRTLPLSPGTAKLVKLLKVPVVTPRFYGGYLAHPRWARSKRNGPLYIDYSLALSGKDAGDLPVWEIERRLTAALAHDDHAWQSQCGVRYRSSRPAEYAEHVLFLCPSCKATGTIESEKHLVRCSSCGLAAKVDAAGNVSPAAGRDAELTTISAWHDWELATIPELVRPGSQRPRPLLRDREIICRSGFRTNTLKEIGAGTLELWDRELYFTFSVPRRSRRRLRRESGRRPLPNAATPPGSETELRLPLAALRGINVQLQRELELYHGNTLYTFTPRSPRVSMYKWERFLFEIQRRARDRT